MNAFTLKLIACSAMLLDHIGFFTGNTTLRIIGRIALPIYAYLIASGYKKSKDPFKYLLRICTFAVISEPIYDYCFHGVWVYDRDQNIMFTLALGLAALIILDHMKFRFPISALALIPVALLCQIAEKCSLDYGYWVVLLIVVYGVFDGKNVYSSTMLSVSTLFFAARFPISFYMKMALIKIRSLVPFLSLIPIKQPNQLSDWYMMQIYAVVALLFILFYNGKRGIEIKNRIGQLAYQYAFYAFYPLHLLVLILVF